VTINIAKNQKLEAQGLRNLFLSSQKVHVKESPEGLFLKDRSHKRALPDNIKQFYLDQRGRLIFTNEAGDLCAAIVHDDLSLGVTVLGNFNVQNPGDIAAPERATKYVV
jgi:hypothetical protein